MSGNLPIFNPTEIARISRCALQHHFWRQSPPADGDDPLAAVIRLAIQHLHAAGGPYRLNLPATLKLAENSLFSSDQAAIARQILADYHRRLRNEWPRVIASSELLALTIRFARQAIVCEGVADRLDKDDDGGITVVQFVTTFDLPPAALSDEAIEPTLLHALVAAAYPHRRPVRLVYRWLYHNRDLTLQLTEKNYRRNLDLVRNRLQAWFNGELLARPGLHCQNCLFQYQGCPLYPADSLETRTSNLADSALPATLSARNWNFVEDTDHANPETDP